MSLASTSWSFSESSSYADRADSYDLAIGAPDAQGRLGGTLSYKQTDFYNERTHAQGSVSFQIAADATGFEVVTPIGTFTFTTTPDGLSGRTPGRHGDVSWRR